MFIHLLAGLDLTCLCLYLFTDYVHGYLPLPAAHHLLFPCCDAPRSRRGVAIYIHPRSWFISKSIRKSQEDTYMHATSLCSLLGVYLAAQKFWLRTQHRGSAFILQPQTMRWGFFWGFYLPSFASKRLVTGGFVLQAFYLKRNWFGNLFSVPIMYSQTRLGERGRKVMQSQMFQIELSLQIGSFYSTSQSLSWQRLWKLLH